MAILNTPIEYLRVGRVGGQVKCVADMQMAVR
jgi:hypothetical protein